MSFYEKAVVWLGLNEEYPESVESTHGQPVERDLPAASGGFDEAVPGRRMDADSEVPRAPERMGPRPAQQPPRKPAVDSNANRNPLQHDARRDRSEGTVRVIPMDDSGSGSAANGSGSMSGSTSKSASGSVRSADPLLGTVRAVPLPTTTKPSVIVPQSFNDAQSVADMYRDSKPVIVNMQSAERDLARRLIDFSSGLCYGLGGQMEKVAKDVYLLTPSDVQVAEEDRDKF